MSFWNLILPDFSGIISAGFAKGYKLHAKEIKKSRQIWETKAISQRFSIFFFVSKEL